MTKHLSKACFFLGYPRSGHTLIGALLDAHPNCCFSHELDMLGRLLRGEITKETMIEEIIVDSRSQLQDGRTNAGYHYLVPNQWQGQYVDLRVLGDKSGGRSSRLLDQYTPVLPDTQSYLQLELIFIHVIRNPFDSISTSVNRVLDRLPNAKVADVYAKKSQRFFMQARAIHQFKIEHYVSCV